MESHQAEMASRFDRANDPHFRSSRSSQKVLVLPAQTPTNRPSWKAVEGVVVAPNPPTSNLEEEMEEEPNPAMSWTEGAVEGEGSTGLAVR